MKTFVVSLGLNLSLEQKDAAKEASDVIERAFDQIQGRATWSAYRRAEHILEAAGL